MNNKKLLVSQLKSAKEFVTVNYPNLSEIEQLDCIFMVFGYHNIMKELKTMDRLFDFCDAASKDDSELKEMLNGTKKTIGAFEVKSLFDGNPKIWG